MKSEIIEIKRLSSGHPEFCRLVVSLRNISDAVCDTVIGFPSAQNIRKEMEIGDAVLFETPTEGVIEARLTEVNFPHAKFLVTQVSPKAGLLGGAYAEDPNNERFSNVELEKIQDSLEKSKASIAAIKGLQAEHVDLLSRKLDELALDSKRLGRKDWINCVSGSLGGVIANAALPPEQVNQILQAISSAFEWLFTNALYLVA